MAAKGECPTKAEQLEAELSKIYERLSVCGRAWKSVSELIRLAKDGDKMAIAFLSVVANETVGALNNAVKRQPKFVRSLSRGVWVWPALISRKRAHRRENDKLMAALQLGEGAIYSQRQWQLSARSTLAAIKLFTVSGLRAPPRFTKKNKKQFFEKSWTELLKDGFKPEESDFWAPLGKSKATKTPKYCKNLHKRTRDANVRAEIKARVWEAFDNCFAGQKSK